MEEADEFIREACTFLECSFADNDEIEFSTPQIFEFLVRCIWRIDPTSKREIPSYVYPNVITARLHLGNAIFNYLQSFNIRGDTALHTVLYGNINNLRSAFIELIRKLPADSSESDSQDQGQQFLENVCDTLNSQPKHVPAYCRGLIKKQKWTVPNKEPEVFPLNKSNTFNLKFTSRNWISQYINSSFADQAIKSQRPKPALPPKPVFVGEQKNSEQEPVEGRTQISKEIDEAALLQTEYDQTIEEYEEMQQRRYEVERQNLGLQRKLSEYHPELMEALQDPEVFVQKLSEKIFKLTEQMDDDTKVLEDRSEAAARKKLKMNEELRRLGTHDREIRKLGEMQAAFQGIEEKIEDKLETAESLKNRLARTDESIVKKMRGFEKRSRDLDEMVRKQESEMVKMEEEQADLRKQEERDSEAVNRSFAIIYNILLQQCDHYRGQLAMESFTRIHLYCMEILDMLKNNGALKQTVLLLQSEIDVEEQKEYDRQFDLLSKDYHEINELNKELFSLIKLQNPDFEMPVDQ